MKVSIEESWKTILAKEFDSNYFVDLVSFLKKEYATKRVYPKGREIFNAFNLCSFNHTKVVIVGQDPYHGFGQAHGLCFSVRDGIPLPPSLKNIFIEIKNDIGKEMPHTGNLERWAHQGVLLLNTILTVIENRPGSHQRHGWETFTDKVLEIIAQEKENVVFLLWGRHAQSKEKLISKKSHLILKAAHPSPFSAHNGFFGNKHFSQTNQYLHKMGIQQIEW